MNTKNQTGTRRVSRRAVVLGGSTLAASTFAAPVFAPAIAQPRPIKIGVLAPISGPFSNLGAQKVNGMKMLFDEKGMKVGDRPISLLVEDDEFKPQEALRKARKLFESEGVDILLGVISSSIGYALKDYAARAQKVWITTGAAADGIFRKSNNNPYAFRSSLSVWQANSPMGTWLASKGFKRAVISGPDYAMGQEATSAFAKAFVKGGGEIVGSSFAPLATTDFAPYLSQVATFKPDVVYATYGGPDAVRFVQQFVSMGLASSIKLAGYGYLAEEDIFAAQGDTVLGVPTGLNWAYGLQTDENIRFVQEFKKRYNAAPSIDGIAGYVGAQVAHAALGSLGGGSIDQRALSAAVGAVKLVTPRGPVSFDPATNNVIQNIYIREPRKKDGEIHNAVLETYERVVDPGE